MVNRGDRQIPICFYGDSKLFVAKRQKGCFLKMKKHGSLIFFTVLAEGVAATKKPSWDLTALIGPQNLKIFVADTGERSEPPKGIQKGENWCDRD
jgi:hypothetical protein